PVLVLESGGGDAAARVVCKCGEFCESAATTTTGGTRRVFKVHRVCNNQPLQETWNFGLARMPGLDRVSKRKTREALREDSGKRLRERSSARGGEVDRRVGDDRSRSE